jgi:GTPase SAR1 family protein
MLRQIHVFHKTKNLPIFSHSYAMALGEKELKNVVELIKPYLEMPKPGKTFQIPIADFQIFYRSSGDYTILFVVDKIDQLERVEDGLKATVAQFIELFKYPEELEDSEFKKNQFLEFIGPLQQEFHSKISIIGPTNSGKTSFYDLLQNGDERHIMNFAKVSTYLINKLSFDVWDFDLQDNFSLLWPKFISGSDLVLFIFDMSNYHLRVFEHFKSMITTDAPLSKFLIIGNKRDLVDDSEVKFIKNELEIQDFIEISVKEAEARQQLDQIISEILSLKKSLPDDYSRLLKEAENLEANFNLVMAIAKYKEIIKMADNFQDLNLIHKFTSKVETLQAKVDEKNQLRKIRDSRKKFEIPDKIQFDTEIKVKPLPSSEEQIFQPKARKFQSFGTLEKVKKEEKSLGDFTLFNKAEKIENKKFLTPSDVQIDLKGAKPLKVDTKPLKIEEKLEITRDEDINPEELKKLIEAKGSSLSINLCKLLISDLKKALSRPLKIEDLEMAAEVFVRNELKV